MAALFIHLEEVASAVANKQGTSGFTSHYVCRFREALDATNTTLGAHLTLDSCIEWGRQLRVLWKAKNHVQLGNSSGGDTAALSAAITQNAGFDWNNAANIAQACCHARGTAFTSGSSAPLSPRQDDVVVEAHTLAGRFFNWFTLDMWHTATQKRQQFVRADLKACISIMMATGGRDMNIPAAPALWTLAEDLDKKVNCKLRSIDGKITSKTASSLRKRWRKLRLEHQPEYKALCSAYILRKAANGIVDQCTPDTHIWKQKDLEL
ncbi:hypothetical protein GN958_ATG09367 [Phytophthora infestans]|uniref:Uncharacterized protein n=1 Tax=Phytophthora infestans TaxID=4787 RepID=A0A8S9UL48_PHYIN|nr:hypothetical protein GN958_ATG09367 [Phytophthora infestans]